MFVGFLPRAEAADQIVVDVSQVIRPAERRIIGINTNYFTDFSQRRANGQGYAAALCQMGVNAMRFPGGEKADDMLWSVPPFTAPAPQLARLGDEWPANDPTLYNLSSRTYVNDVMDFDEFMVEAQRRGAEPIIVVAFDSMYKAPPRNGTTPTKQQLLDASASWVRYANVVKGYGIRYWEIGNESYNDAWAGGAKAADYARDFLDFAAAMKAIDPTILVGANGDYKDNIGALDEGATTAPWWKTILDADASAIDFVVVHSYSFWRGSSYETYRTTNPDQIDVVHSVKDALAAWAPADAARIRILVTELNPADFSGPIFGNPTPWANTSDLGHALALFDMLGQLLVESQVDAAAFWNTRWFNAKSSLWNALDGKNELSAVGRALQAWSGLLETMVTTMSTATIVQTWATHGANGDVTVWLENKDYIARAVDVEVQNNGAGWWSGDVWSLQGTGPEDARPTWSRTASVTAAGTHLALTLPPVSVTRVRLVASGVPTDPASCGRSVPTLCAPSPIAACQSGAQSKILIKDRSSDRKDRLGWTWFGSSNPGALGDPTTATDYELCLYDAKGLYTSLRVEAGGDCAAKPCWRNKGSGSYLYANKKGAFPLDGVTNLSTKIRGTGAKLQVKAAGEWLTVPPPSTLSSPLVAQLVNNTGACWQASYTFSPLPAGEGYFKARSG